MNFLAVSFLFLVAICGNVVAFLHAPVQRLNLNKYSLHMTTAAPAEDSNVT